MEREEQRKADADADADFGGIFEGTREFSSPFLLLGYLPVCVYVMCCGWKGKGDEILGSCDCPHSLEVNGLKDEATLLLLLLIYLFI